MESLRIPGRVLQLFGFINIFLTLVYGFWMSLSRSMTEGLLIIVAGLVSAALVYGIGSALLALDTLVSNSNRTVKALERLTETRQHNATEPQHPRIKELGKEK